MIKEPKYFFERGNGTLSGGEYKLSVEFEMYLISGEIVLYCKPNNINPFFFLNVDQLTLSGVVTSGEKIQATNLLAPLITNDFIELIPNPFVYIGDYFDNFCDKMEIQIMNLFDVKLSFEYDGFNIQIEPFGDKIQERISRYWKIPQVGSLIKISKENELIENYNFVINGAYAG